MNKPAIIPLKKIILETVKSIPELMPHLSEDSRAFIAQQQAIKAGDIESINATYHDAITEAILDYFNGGSVVASRNAFKRAMVQAFGDTVDLAWLDGGAELPVEGDVLAWFNTRVDEEMGYVDRLFQEAKNLRKDTEFDYFAWASTRADGYVNTLRTVYNYARTAVMDNVMVTFRLGQTEKHCKSCLKLNGDRHKLSWFIKYKYVPPSGEALECSAGGHCDCKLEKDDGDIITI